jgi:iron complex outermembrane receptor protein
MLDGFSIGGGVRYVGATQSFAKDLNSGTELYLKTPSYTLFDGMVAYETEDWRWQLTVQNLADKYYVTSCSASRGDCAIGQARTILTGLTYKF